MNPLYQYDTGYHDKGHQLCEKEPNRYKDTRLNCMQQTVDYPVTLEHSDVSQLRLENVVLKAPMISSGPSPPPIPWRGSTNEWKAESALYSLK